MTYSSEVYYAKTVVKEGKRTYKYNIYFNWVVYLHFITDLKNLCYRCIIYRFHKQPTYCQADSF